MENPKIQPDKITKPIQLLAVWFAGLVLLVSLLLAGAKTITSPIWLTPVLAISAILIIPLFLYFVFLLQTKYRPQMQEDTFYSKYLDTSTNKTIIVTEDVKKNPSVTELKDTIIQLTESNKFFLKNIEELVKSKTQDNQKISEIEKYIIASNENFNRVEQTIKKTQFEIYLNRLLPKFSETRLLLLKNDFENIEEFTGGSKKQLDKFLISVGLNVEPKFVAELLKILQPLGLELINIIENGYEMEHYKDALVIGSHAYNIPERTTLKVDNILIETISNIESRELFHKMFK